MSPSEPAHAAPSTAAASQGFPTHHRIVILTDGYSTPFVAKTAISLLRYRTSDIVAVLDQTAVGQTAQELLHAGGQIPVVGSLADVADADSLYVGIAPPGGKLPEEWRSIICQALQRGMDVVSGLHDFLVQDEEYVRLAQENNCRLIDVRLNRHKTTGVCHKFRPGCVRIHSVGHDCSVGKMVTTLELQRGLTDAGHDAKFLATGQTGIMISGEGVPIDCVVADFVSGAAEQLAMQNEQHDILLVEGQGSISHPSFSAVTLGLLHGSAPDGLIFCYEAGRHQVKGLDNIDIPPLKHQMAACLVMANLRHPCRFIGVAVNTRNLTPEEAAQEIARAEEEFELPACDVYRDGADKLVAAVVALREEILAS
jgi:uncharacterized NAD-dependent epimerase/dehydratase family protein